MRRTGFLRGYKWWMAAAWIVFACCALHTARDAWHWDMPFAPRRDFVQLFAGARCAVAHENPYDTKLLEAQYLAAGGLKEHLPPWKWELPLYPPSALLFGLPFVGMRYDAAAQTWFWFNLCALFAGLGLVTLLVERGWRPLAVVLAACVVWYPATVLVLGMGQPAALTLALLFVAVVVAFRRWPGWICVVAFGLALLLKAQLALPILIYLLLVRRYRKSAGAALVLWVVVSLGCVFWMQHFPGTSGWSAALRANIAASMATGGSANPEPSNGTVATFTNLQAVMALFFSSARGYNLATYLFVLPVGLWWLAGIWRAPWSPGRDVLAIAGGAALALLPVYSFYYNLPLLGLCVPAVVWLLAHRLRWGIAALLCLTPVAFCNLQLHVQHFVIVHPRSQLPGRLGTVVVEREYPLAVALSAVLLVAALWWCAPSETADGQLRERAVDAR